MRFCRHCGYMGRGIRFSSETRLETALKLIGEAKAQFQKVVAWCDKQPQTPYQNHRRNLTAGLITDSRAIYDELNSIIGRLK